MPVERPNILVAIADDYAWPHAGAYGCSFVRTPSFDRVAREGVLFDNCFCPAPSCAPSRASLLTGRNPWELEEGGNLWGTLPARFDVYPDLLESAGYHVGYTNKGWGPGSVEESGRMRNPAGEAYNRYTSEPPTRLMSWNDYAANFQEFLKQRPNGSPFCFWYGAKEPHRPYVRGSGLSAGKRLADVEVPPFLPDCDEVRSDLLDYALEVEWFDTQLGRMLDTLDQAGELDNTIVVVTGDNGMPFPRAKANVYEIGMHVPLAIRWGAHAPGGRRVTDLLTFVDFAPTFLEAAGVAIPTETTGTSLVPILKSPEEGRVDEDRDFALTGRERHAFVRDGNRGYPSRCIRTDEWIYIRNFEPQRWPAGDPPVYGDVDASPSKHYLIRHRDEEGVRRLHDLAFGKRPAEELYRVSDGYGCLENLAQDPAYAETKEKLRQRMETALIHQGDPRLTGEAKFDTYAYYGNNKDRNGVLAFTGTDALRDEGLLEE